LATSYQPDADIDLIRCDSSGVDQEVVVNIDGSTGVVTLAAGNFGLGNNSITNAMMQDNSVDSAEIVAGAIDLAHMSVNSIDSDQYVDGSIDSEHFAAGAVNITALGTGAVSPVKVLATAISPAADAACAILNTTTEINLTVTAAGTVVISTTSSVAGQRIVLIATAVAGGGSYTLALVSGTLTLDSTGETAEVVRNAPTPAGARWPLTAGVAAGAPATVSDARARAIALVDTSGNLPEKEFRIRSMRACASCCDSWPQTRRPTGA
jgi:hypothetical protein